MRHLLLLRTAGLGMRRKDYAGAHELAVDASSMADAGVADWVLRVDTAYMARNELDTCRSVTHFFRQWPDKRARIPDNVVWSVARTPTNEAEKECRSQVLETLYEARWTDQYGVEPGDLWGLLIKELTERGDLNRALEVVAHVDSPRVMVMLHADKRFDALVSKAPARFDIAAAAEREIGDWSGAVQRFPRKLDAFVQLTYALLDVGQHDAAYQLTHDILSRVDNDNFHRFFDDDETALNWILDYNARALEAQQHWNEAEWELRSAADRLEQGKRNVSNIINLASFEQRSGRGDEALNVLAELPVEDTQVTPYGRMQWYDVQLAAALAMGNTALADASLAYMASHRADALSTYQFALVRANRLDEAAETIIRRLADPASRSFALSEIQQYRDPPANPAQQLEHDRLQQLLQRADVRQSIERVGRVLDVPLPSPLD